jgi:hypothetical protein
MTWNPSRRYFSVADSILPPIAVFIPTPTPRIIPASRSFASAYCLLDRPDYTCDQIWIASIHEGSP